ncbi:MAG: DUF2917 domain-containing protein [Pseudomonadota bacterium]
MDHHLGTLSASSSSAGPSFKAQAAQQATATASSRHINPGHAITLRAKKLSVLRITHGRVWATLTDVGPYSRVTSGDHFLSRGESLTLLPGQSLVMESFGIGHAAPAQFSWETPGIAAVAVPVAKASSIAEPLRDLRHALGLVAGASGRLVNGLGQGVASSAAALLGGLAMTFVASRADRTGATAMFDVKSGCARTAQADCRAV